jgi:flavin-binding protein dodecin
MSNHVYKLLELTGSSSVSIEDAVSTAIAKAHETVRNIQLVDDNYRGRLTTTMLAG